jgi:hypothetical protein
MMPARDVAARTGCPRPQAPEREKSRTIGPTAKRAVTVFARSSFARGRECFRDADHHDLAEEALTASR